MDVGALTDLMTCCNAEMNVSKGGPGPRKFPLTLVAAHPRFTRCLPNLVYFVEQCLTPKMVDDNIQYIDMNTFLYIQYIYIYTHISIYKRILYIYTYKCILYI